MFYHKYIVEHLFLFMHHRPFFLFDTFIYLFIFNCFNHTMVDDGDRERGDGEDTGEGGVRENSRINVETASLYLVLHRKSYDQRRFCLNISHIFLHC